MDRAEQVPPPSKFGLVMQPAPNAVYVEKTRTPSLSVSLDRRVFHVRLNNGMPRVFRGSGIAVQFNIAGKVAMSDASVLAHKDKTAPIKPMPVTICAATRDGSRTTSPFARTFMKPYFEIGIKRAAAVPTTVELQDDGIPIPAGPKDEVEVLTDERFGRTEKRITFV